MKILIVCQFYYPENFTITAISKKLVSLGHEVDVLTGKPNYGFGQMLEGYENISYEVIDGVHVHRVNIKARGKKKSSIINNYLSYYFAANKWVKKCKKKYDVVYSMSLSPVTILGPANKYKKKFKVKHLSHCVDLWPESVLVTNAVKKTSLMYKILHFWSKKLYSGADKILVGSPSFKQYFSDVLKIKKPIDYLPQCALHTKLESNEKYQFNDNKFHILYCGNIGTIQLVEQIPLAFKDVKNDDIHFDIIGYGTNQEILKERIKRFNLENKITYHGPIKSIDTVKYFNGADALFVSLKNEGYVGKTIPNKLIMAMAFNKPILAMLDGDGKNILNAAAGGIVSEMNIKELTKNIEKIATTDKETLKKMGDNNYNYYLKNFDVEIIAKRIEKELIELID